MTIKKEKFSVTCADGVSLKGTLLIPEQPKAVVQFNGGTAAKKEFYLPFLEYLAENHYLCCLWDYRGSGESAPKDLATCEYTFRDYGLKDMPAIKQYLRERFPALPFLFFGHSVGGQQMGFMNKLDDVKGMVGFAVSTGYTLHHPFYYRFIAGFFFLIFTPLSIALTGYLKAKKFGIMEDLPKNVVLEWRAWCFKKNYIFDKKFSNKTVPTDHFKALPFPIHIFWATDDPISNKKSVPTFWSHVKSKFAITFSKIIPSEVGAKSIGHFGFFNKKHKNTLWPRALTKLNEFLSVKTLSNA
ncbi:MAG: alpha/beta fold hydrolase [Flammeovirgaceae bacterium]